MTKKEIYKNAELQIREGKSRQEIFDGLQDSCGMPIQDLAKIISKTSPLTLRKKYNWLNIVLIILLLITIVLKMISGIPLIAKLGIEWFPLIFVLPIINVVLLIGVINYKPGYHMSVGFLSLIGLFNGLSKINTFDLYVILDLLIIFLLIFLGFYLQNKLAPSSKMIKEKFTNDKGYTKIRDKIVFEN